MPSFPKFQYVRSEALMKAYRMIECQHCDKADGTVAGAHSNWHEHGKGRSIKASDVYCASLCFWCHSLLDAGPMMRAEERRVMWTNAWRKTIKALVSKGLWPQGIEVPDTEEQGPATTPAS